MTTRFKMESNGHWLVIAFTRDKGEFVIGEVHRTLPIGQRTAYRATRFDGDVSCVDVTRRKAWAGVAP